MCASRRKCGRISLFTRRRYDDWLDRVRKSILIACEDLHHCHWTMLFGYFKRLHKVAEQKLHLVYLHFYFPVILCSLLGISMSLLCRNIFYLLFDHIFPLRVYFLSTTPRTSCIIRFLHHEGCICPRFRPLHTQGRPKFVKATREHALRVYEHTQSKHTHRQYIATVMIPGHV